MIQAYLYLAEYPIEAVSAEFVGGYVYLHQENTITKLDPKDVSLDYDSDNNDSVVGITEFLCDLIHDIGINYCEQIISIQLPFINFINDEKFYYTTDSTIDEIIIELNEIKNKLNNTEE